MSVAFLTLFERKLLSYIQVRKGPNKVGVLGLLQPFRDAIKLFSKESILLLKSNYLFFLFSPMLIIIIILILWNNVPFISELINYSNNLLIILCFIRLRVYGLIISGWSSNSIYSLIGRLRSIAQTISYEVSIIFIIINIILLVESFNINKFIFFQKRVWFFFMILPLGLIFFVSLLAEINRIPFDFAEGESELVSGFNTEYIRGRFAIIFIAEYGIIIFIIFLFMFFFWGGKLNSFFFFIFYLFILYLVIWVRRAFPRFRYDNLIYITWKLYLPLRIFILIFILGVKSIVIR